MKLFNKSLGAFLSTRTAVALLVIFIWSGCFVIIKTTYRDAPPLVYAAMRALLGGVPLLMVATASQKLLPPARTWGWIVALGAANTTLGLSGMFLSVGVAGAAIPAVLANSQALFVAPFATLLFGEALTRGRIAGLLVGTGGVLLIVLGSEARLGSMEGALLALVATGGLAVGNLIIKHIGKRVDALIATAWQYVLGGLLLLVWSFLSEDLTKVVWSAHFLGGLLFLGLVGSGLASWIWYHLVKKSELIALNSLTLLTPVFALLLALLLYGEPVSKRSLLGTAMVLGGVFWVSLPEVRKK